MTTVTVHQIESLRDVVERITGVPQPERVPDAIIRDADRVELVDVAPAALRDRLAEGVVYPAERIDAELSNFFRIGNLSALRELALLWLADDVDDAVRSYRTEHRIETTWEARERVVVALAGGPEDELLIRRAARIAARSGTRDLIAVHIGDPQRISQPHNAQELEAASELVASLGGSLHRLVATSIAGALIEFSRSVNASQLVIGVRRRGWIATLVGGARISSAVIRQAGDIDVHIVSHASRVTGRLPRARGTLGWRRRVAGAAVAVVGIPALAAALTPFRSTESLATDVLAFQLLVVVVALVGGIWPALVAALVAGVTLNYFFIDPLYTLTIRSLRDVVAIGIFVIVAALVSIVVDEASRRSRAARRSAAEAQTLVSVAGAVISGTDALATLIDRLRQTFGLTSVLLLENGITTHSSRDGERARDDDVETTITLGEGAQLYLRGAPLSASERTIVGAFASQVTAALIQRRLASEAEAARPLAEADRMRSALLASVGHDVRRPLASATAAVTALRLGDEQLSVADRADLVQTAEDSLRGLATLLTDLLDVSRLQAGYLGVELAPVSVDDLVAGALDELAVGPSHIDLNLAPVAAVTADAILARRALVNLIDNALRHSPEGERPVISSSTFRGRVQVRVIDRGVGVPPDRHAEMFVPFQRMTDTDNESGLGLGLALSKGFIEVMGGTLEPEDTPGGGLTMVIELPDASAPSPERGGGGGAHPLG
jgi:two-component system sensor histidine kinase KdpD